MEVVDEPDGLPANLYAYQQLAKFSSRLIYLLDDS